MEGRIIKQRIKEGMAYVFEKLRAMWRELPKEEKERVKEISETYSFFFPGPDPVMDRMDPGELFYYDDCREERFKITRVDDYMLEDINKRIIEVYKFAIRYIDFGIENRNNIQINTTFRAPTEAIKQFEADLKEMFPGKNITVQVSEW